MGLKMQEPEICPYHGNKLRAISSSVYACGKCALAIYIAAEYLIDIKAVTAEVERE